MMWELSHRADPRGAAIADRHYSRQKIGSPQFMPPGGCCVLYAGSPDNGQALWGTSTPFAEYVKHAWPGAWMCSIFRNEGAGVASELIRDAVSATRAIVGEPPAYGMLTFIKRSAVRPTCVRGEETWGWTYRRAGFREVGETKGGLLAFQLLPEDMPDPQFPRGHRDYIGDLV